MVDRERLELLKKHSREAADSARRLHAVAEHMVARAEQGERLAPANF